MTLHAIHDRLDRAPFWQAHVVYDKADDRAARTAAEAEAHQLTAEIGARPDNWLPAPWRAAPDHPFGPRTALLRLRAAQLWGAGPSELARLLENAELVDLHDSLVSPVPIARAAAQRTRREQAVRIVERSVPALVEAFLADPVRRDDWADVLRARHRLGPDDPISAADGFGRALVCELVTSCLTIEVVADVVDPQWLTHARGPWLTALQCAPGELPGPAWRAAPPVLDTIVDLLAPRSTAELMQLARNHADALAGAGPVLDPRYPDLVARLSAWTLLGGADCPWHPTLECLPGWTDVYRALGLSLADARSTGGPGHQPRPGLRLGRLPDLHHWARALAAALSHRARLTADDIAAFTGPVAGLLPELGARLGK